MPNNYLWGNTTSNADELWVDGVPLVGNNKILGQLITDTDYIADYSPGGDLGGDDTVVMEDIPTTDWVGGGLYTNDDDYTGDLICDISSLFSGTCADCDSMSSDPWDEVMEYSATNQWTHFSYASESIDGVLAMQQAICYWNGTRWELIIECWDSDTSTSYVLWDGTKSYGDDPRGRYWFTYADCTNIGPDYIEVS
jgi:hypothetical protein